MLSVETINELSTIQTGLVCCLAVNSTNRRYITPTELDSESILPPIATKLNTVEVISSNGDAETAKRERRIRTREKFQTKSHGRKCWN